MTSWRRWLTGIGAVGIVCLAPPPSRAQTPAPVAPSTATTASPPPLRVFLDCNRCDTEYLLQNVGFVDYVRDRAVADLHVLVTTESTGGNGLRWTVAFLGVGRLAGQDRTYTFTTAETASQDDQRREFARVFKIGLVAYAAATSIPPDVDVTWTRPAAGATTAAAHDPWNYWVFRIGADGYQNGEKSSNSATTQLSVSANRTTDNWKVRLSSSGSLNRNRFQIDDQTTVRSSTHEWDVNGLIVKSLTPKWSLGGTMSASHSSYSNIAHAFSVAPGVEYDFFPYSQSSRRSLAIRYTAGVVRNDYTELTIYQRLRDTLAKQYLNASLGLRQPWGTLNVASSFSQQFGHFDRYRESLSGNADIRLFKGFSFNVFAEYNTIADQISLKNDAASEEAVLLRLQQLQTNYSYYISFGVSYSFGSIFNSIVNPRFTF